MTNLISVDNFKELIDIPFLSSGVSFNANNVVQHLPRTVNQLTGIIGDDVVLRGMNVLSIIDNDGYDVDFVISPGYIIQDKTLIKINESTNIRMSGTLSSYIINNLSENDLEQGRFIIYTYYQFFEQGLQEPFRFGIGYVNNNGIVDGNWYFEKNRIILDSFKVNFDFAYGKIDSIISSFPGETLYFEKEIRDIVIPNISFSEIKASASFELDGIILLYEAREPGESGNKITINHKFSYNFTNIHIDYDEYSNGEIIITINIPRKPNINIPELVQLIENSAAINKISVTSYGSDYLTLQNDLMDVQISDSDIYTQNNSDVVLYATHLSDPLSYDVKLSGGISSSNNNNISNVYIINSQNNINSKVAISYTSENIDNLIVSPCSRSITIHGKTYFQYGYDLEKLTLIDYIKYIVNCYISNSGNSGLSAYQIWLNNGYYGSENDFLNWLRSTPSDLDFLSLEDTPNSYDNNINNFLVAVNDDASGLVFKDPKEITQSNSIRCKDENILITNSFNTINFTGDSIRATYNPIDSEITVNCDPEFSSLKLYTYESSTPLIEHTITHNLGVDFFKCDVYIQNPLTLKWESEFVNLEIIDNNNIKVYLSEESNIRICAIYNSTEIAYKPLQMFEYQSEEPKIEHLIYHNLDTYFMKIDVLVENNEGTWGEGFVSLEFINNNYIKVILSEEANIKFVAIANRK
jgi:hypothetical protein